MNLSDLAGVVGLATLEGGLVAVPRADALKRLGPLNSPVWAAVLPGAILVGTFGVRALPPIALGLVVLAVLVTPLLSTAAILAVVRGPRAATLPIAVTLAILAAFHDGWTGQLSATMLTGLGCLTVGMVLVRLIPLRYILTSVLCMCAVDATLLAIGAGQPSAALMNHASAELHQAVFDHAAIGPITTDYPDLVLAAVLGGSVAGQAAQRRAAALLTTLAAGYGILVPVAGMIPATIPIAVTFLIVRPTVGRPTDLARRVGAPA